MYPCWIKRFSKAERPVGTTQTRVGDTHCASECNQKIGKSNRHPCDATNYFHRNPVSFFENTDLRLFSLTLLIPPLQKKVPALHVPEPEGTALLTCLALLLARGHTISREPTFTPTPDTMANIRLD